MKYGIWNIEDGIWNMKYGMWKYVLQNYARGNDFEDWKKVYFQRKQINIIIFW